MNFVVVVLLWLNRAAAQVIITLFHYTKKIKKIFKKMNESHFAVNWMCRGMFFLLVCYVPIKSDMLIKL